MLEVELKFRRHEPDRLLERLAELGARDDGRVRQTDTYFNHPARDFGLTGETVRVRDTAGRAALTYKGPLVDGETKSRRETEIDLAGTTARERMVDWLEAVGFRPVGTVEKLRHAWALVRADRTVEIALDDVVGLGRFVELETLADDRDFPAARGLLLALAGELELSAAERRGYLTMLLEHPRSQPGADS